MCITSSRRVDDLPSLPSPRSSRVARPGHPRYRHRPASRAAASPCCPCASPLVEECNAYSTRPARGRQADSPLEHTGLAGQRWSLRGRGIAGIHPRSRRGSDRSEGDAAQRGRWRPRVLRRDSSVVGATMSGWNSSDRIASPGWIGSTEFTSRRSPLCAARPMPAPTRGASCLRHPARPRRIRMTRIVSASTSHGSGMHWKQLRRPREAGWTAPPRRHPFRTLMADPTGSRLLTTIGPLACKGTR